MTVLDAASTLTERIIQIAERLSAAEADVTAIAPLTETTPDLTVEDAYRVQLLNVERRRAAGERVRGHKVGLTSRVMQEQLGVDEPDYGHLFDSMFVYEGADIAVSELCAPRVEVEVAFVLGKELRGPGCTVADVLMATEYVLPSLEIIDSRIADWRITLPDTIADNASSARIVLGANPTRLEDVDVRALGAVLSLNGEVVATGASAAVLGNPVTAVAWLANKVADFDVRLEPGHVVLPGSCTKAVPVAAGDAVRAEFDQLGHVAVNFV
jgi:2-keto-4-pentenoate hydratase